MHANAPSGAPENSEAPYCYVFGPVYSRRLGRSLGVDLVPFKTCSYDCVYCQLGPTTADHGADAGAARVCAAGYVAG
jgi:wyosine [tRNA(Phe)-imidazoG37] synthetase (radical SAM superfamily)